MESDYEDKDIGIAWEKEEFQYESVYVYPDHESDYEDKDIGIEWVHDMEYTDDKAT